MGTLYIVSTPIGNLGDLTARAARVLEGVERVLAEDTRRTGRLLEHLAVRVPLTSLHAHNEASRRTQVLAWLEEGADLALVSDAGTPLVSDPGARLVEAVLRAGHEVVPVPGASAVLAALVVSGFAADRFTFLGFLPRRGTGRKQFIGRIAAAQEATVLFESPERLSRLIEDLAEACGAARRVAVSRELTKLHETTFRGTLGEAARYYEEDPPRGEVTLVVEALPPGDESGVDRESALELALSLLAQGESPSRATREVATRLDISRNEAYRIVQEAKNA